MVFRVSEQKRSSGCFVEARKYPAWDYKSGLQPSSSPTCPVWLLLEGLIAQIARVEADEAESCLISPYFHLSEQNLSHTEALIWNRGNPSSLSAIQSKYWMKFSQFSAKFPNHTCRKLFPFFCSLVHWIFNFIFQLEKVQQVVLRKDDPKSVRET